jgi:catechol 2,3-dioxygenase-like lactoylglutathione lyase family enzyme
MATVAMIAPDPARSRKLYVEALGLPLHGEGDGYHHSEQVAGCKSFGIWPLSQAVKACFWNRRVALGAAGAAGQHRV